MQPLFKLLTSLLTLMFLTNFACNKEKPFMNDGVITGFDSRMCPCCGGLMINFVGEIQPYKGSFYLIENNPSDLKINDSSTFPIYLKVDWTQKSVGCAFGGLGNIIKIIRFKKQ